ncbi:MAG: TlpA family protein disulfide reductase [Solirubrobacteraceae bacterium]|nr:TlpA family protein disulfide reductase [Solirubrobacteraceae bacterium]
MKRSAVPFVAILAVAALVGLLVYGVAANGEDTTIDEAVAKQEYPQAPSLPLPVLGGDGERSPADYAGQVVVLNFWASWCDPCRDEAPVLEAAQKRLEASGDGTVLGVTYRDATSDSLAFMEEYGLTYPSLRDVDGRLAAEYGTRALPETFVIDRRGRIVAVSRGTVDQDFIDAAIDKALAT